VVAELRRIEKYGSIPATETPAVFLGLLRHAVHGIFQTMKSTYTAITREDGEWWIGWIEEIPGVNAQEKSRDELLTSLREILLEALEFNREEARASAGGNYTEELVSV